MMQLCWVFLFSCNNPEKNYTYQEENIDVEVDPDQDGYFGAEDCDENSPSVHIGASEICDGIDNNCDGEIDEGVLVTYYFDGDGDNFGDSTNTQQDCFPADGYVTNGNDCDDEDDAMYPGSMEVCDGLDNDCNDLIDDGLGVYWFFDEDGDGYGSIDTSIQACTQPQGSITTGGDCDDENAQIFPGVDEECDGVDNNCNGQIDETGSDRWFRDEDEDGFGSPSNFVESCVPVEGYIDNNLDCNDTDDSIHPDSVELCDGLDNNCNGILNDNALDGSTWFEDSDMDGYGNPASSTIACTQPAGFSSNDDDCDDSNILISPIALEFCNEIDDDCDGVVDDSDVVDFQVFFGDADGDGFGDSSIVMQACAQGAGMATNNQDCDDTNASIYPYATEVCNGLDDNCNTVIDDGAEDLQLYYQDIDGDGFGSSVTVLVCDGTAGVSAQTGDCDDENAAINPDEIEVCNAVDDNCDGSIDEGLPTTVWYRDSDLDGFGNHALSTYNCQQPSGYVLNDDDCEDGDALINPNSTEICNGLDDDCDNDADAGFLGKDLICLADSCLDILNAHPGAADGKYMINFPSGIEQAQCDMGSFGGGWTQVFMDDMSPPDSGWTLQTTSVCGVWGEILGGYNVISGGSFDNTISTKGIPHSQVWVEMDYITLDSWDETTSQWGPDMAYVQFDGNYIWYTDIDNHLSIYGQVCGWWRPNYPQGSYDSRHYVSTIENGSVTDFTITAGSTLSQGPADESFGLDDVYVWVR
ncbi:MAG: hypothetical protein CL916_05915 [Deltaproteobacteria bacterium]|nr:hypothetical protein [Deltaproteobacteria bacterium]